MNKLDKIETLSKSQYVKAKQCPKALWLSHNRKELIPEVDDAKQALFDQGHEAGELAQQVFPGGIEVKREYWDIQGFIEDTNKLINEGLTTIYEACAISPDGLYSKIDILHKASETEWDLIEVKSSTCVKEYHIDDMASQRYAFQGAGFKIRNSYLMHINNQYVRQGEIDPDQLFILADCTAEVLDRMQGVKDGLQYFLDIKKQKTEPQVEIGAHCNKPFTCDFCDYCWSHVPEYSVYDLLSEQKQETLLEMDVLDVRDIPDGFELTERQFTFVHAYQGDETVVDRKGLKDWVNQLEYPLYYLDYETFNPGIPPFDGVRPFQQVPFQFSLHIQKEPGGECEHLEYLNEESKDPRLEFIEKLIDACGESGSVVVYNQAFESKRNEELAEQFPKYAQQLLAINNRMVDLMVPFQKRYLYKGEQKGSHSIKAVLPAFCLGYSYKDLDIGEGGAASRAGLALVLDKVDNSEKPKLVEDLKKYCGLDTYAMVELVGVVRGYV